MNYSADHASEVRVKYTSSDTEEWSKFHILKKGATASLPSPQLRKYRTPVPIKATEAQKIVEKYVISEHKGFYGVIRSAEFTHVSSVYLCQCIFLFLKNSHHGHKLFFR